VHFIFQGFILQFIILYPLLPGIDIRLPCVFEDISYREAMFPYDHIVIPGKDLKGRIIAGRLNAGIINPDVKIVKWEVAVFAGLTRCREI
jgi:hypothetical protein